MAPIVRHGDAAELAYPRGIVAREVHQHEMLGELLFIREKFFFERAKSSA